MFNILVVDDIIDNIHILTEILKDKYSISAATSGLKAIKIAKKTNPDLILLDIMMPEIDGYETCKLLKNDPLTKDIPIIFITAKTQELDELKAFEVGGVDFITKPISPIITRARIENHLLISNQKRALFIEVKNKTKELNDTRLEIIKKLGHAAEYKDNETGEHIDRMSKISYIIAKNYGLSESQCDDILNSAPMHDVGKIGIPDNILKKPGKLTAKEWEIMKTHTIIGSEIIGDSKATILKFAKIIALEHHEKWDGSGYPMGISREDISIFARIVSISDVFDALTSKRPYKEAWEVNRAIEFINSQSAKHFDPELVNIFNNSMEEIRNIIEVRKVKGD